MKNNNIIKLLYKTMAAVCWCALPVAQVHADSEAFALCAKKFPNQDAERLKCFDTVLAAPAAVAVEAQTASQGRGAARDEPIYTRRGAESLHELYAKPDEPAVPATEGMEERHKPRARRSYLTRVWNLDNRPNRDQSSLDRLQLHRQNYLIARKTSNINNQPSSPGFGNSVLKPYDLDALEAKFLLSFKTDLYTQKSLDIGDLRTFRLWGAYTQQSNWQVFNVRNSSPFRETDYEPELIAAFATGNESGWKLLNLGLVHQSNGRAKPESRSWNRVYVQGGWEWDNTSVLARGWWRIPENILQDDNPDIVHYIGRAELVARWEPDNKSQAIVAVLRNNLNLNQNISFVQLDWSLPVSLGTAARMHAQLTSGHGESMIDYNQRQTTFGMGFSFREW